MTPEGKNGERDGGGTHSRRKAANAVAAPALRKGGNRFFVRVVNVAGVWWVRLRLTNGQGEALGL